MTALLPRSRVLGHLHISPVDLAGPVTGSNFTLGSYEKFQHGFRDENRPKTRCVAKFEKQSKRGETQSYNFRAYHSFGNSYSRITFVKWDAYDVENTAGKARRCRIHPAFIPVTGLKCFLWKNFPPLLPRPRQPSQPALSYERIETLIKNSEVRRDLGNRGSYEEALFLLGLFSRPANYQRA